MVLLRETGKQAEVTWKDLETLAQDLRQISKDSQSTSRTLVELNRFVTTVERYLEAQGLRMDSKGFWGMEHWSYTLLRQLSSRIESCKDAGGQVDEGLLSFVETKLLPRLKSHSSPERLKSS
jgi:hypothetical protein